MQLNVFVSKSSLDENYSYRVILLFVLYKVERKKVGLKNDSNFKDFFM